MNEIEKLKEEIVGLNAVILEQQDHINALANERNKLKDILKNMLRDVDEIQKAHDILIDVANGNFDGGYPPGVRQAAHHSVDVLCWVLKHEHNPSFAQNIQMILNEAKRRGFIVVRKDDKPKDNGIKMNHAKIDEGTQRDYLENNGPKV